MRLSDMRPEARRTEIARRQDTVRVAALAVQFRHAVQQRRLFDEQVLRALDTPAAKEIMLAVVTEAIQRRIGVV
jgi:hypothetical protein